MRAIASLGRDVDFPFLSAWVIMNRNCRNCGAPITNSRCEYCGTPQEKEKHYELWRLGKKVPMDEFEEALCDPHSYIVEVEDEVG